MELELGDNNLELELRGITLSELALIFLKTGYLTTWCCETSGRERPQVRVCVLQTKPFPSPVDIEQHRMFRADPSIQALLC